MMNAMEQMLHRRSCRAFREEMPERELIDQVIEAGKYAASGKGHQSGLILAVTNKRLRDQLSAMNAKIMGAAEGTDPFYGAPAVLVVLAEKDWPTHVYDGSLVMGNLLLAADAVGLGACWIHRAKEAFESEEGKAILAELGITGEYEGIGHCILGYLASTPGAPAPRKENFVYYLE